jgi:hypothetical protein
VDGSYGRGERLSVGPVAARAIHGDDVRAGGGTVQGVCDGRCDEDAVRSAFDQSDQAYVYDWADGFKVFDALGPDPAGTTFNDSLSHCGHDGRGPHRFSGVGLARHNKLAFDRGESRAMGTRDHALILLMT